MEELSKKLQKKYIEDITAKYPLHRFFCLYMYLLALNIYLVKKGDGFIDEISLIKVNYLFDFSKGLLAEVSVSHLFLAVIITLVSARITLLIKNSSFKFLSQLTKVDNYIVVLKGNIKDSKPTHDSVAWVLTAEISKELEVKRNKLRFFHSVSEVSLSLAFCILVGYKSFALVDYLSFFGLVVIILYAQWDSFKSYISEFMPYYVAEKSLLGKDVTFSKDNGYPND